jgi:hypothetical protein
MHRAGHRRHAASSSDRSRNGLLDDRDRRHQLDLRAMNGEAVSA